MFWGSTDHVGLFVCIVCVCVLQLGSGERRDLERGALRDRSACPEGETGDSKHFVDTTWTVVWRDSLWEGYQ